MDFTTYYKTGRQLLDYQVSIYDIIDSGFEHYMESLQMGRDMFRDTEDFISAIYLGFLEHENKYDSNTINLLSQQKQLLKKTNAELRRMERFFEKYDY